MVERDPVAHRALPAMVGDPVAHRALPTMVGGGGIPYIPAMVPWWAYNPRHTGLFHAPGCTTVSIRHGLHAGSAAQRCV